MKRFLQEEAKLLKKGYKYIIGLDEAGRGPLAGPVVATAVTLKILNDKFLIQKRFQNFKTEKLFKNLELEIKDLKLRDSKKLSLKERERLYKILILHPKIEWAVGRVSEKEIDKINILEASKLAMIKAIKKLKIKPDFLIIDGNFSLDLNLPQKSIIKADEKVFSCMVAGIISKVNRDKIMKNYAKKFPQYNFEKNKGYPTKKHFSLIKKHGICPIHRKSFNLIQK